MAMERRENHKPCKGRGIWRGPFVGLMVLALGTAVILGGVLWISLLVRPRHIGLDEIADRTGLQLPASALLVNSWFGLFPRSQLVAQVHIDRADLESLMTAEPLCGNWTRDTDHFPPHLESIDWWNPPLNSQDVWVAYAEARPRIHEGLRQNLEALRVLVAVGDANSVVAYVWSASD